MKNLWLIIIFALIFLILGTYIGFVLFAPKPEQKIDSQIILQELQSQGFLITQTYIIKQDIEIDNSTGQFLKDLFWGQRITATAIMKVSSGVDLQKLSANDISLTNDQINIDLPAIEIQSVEILDEIVLDNKQGILKRLLANDDGYNQALTNLKEQAKIAAQEDKLINEAQQSTINEIKRFIKFIDPDKEINIQFK